MERIIILRSAVLGDFIISSPAMNLIREKHCDAKIYLFTIQSAHKKDRSAVKVYETKKAQPWLDFLDKKIIDEIIPMKSMDFNYLWNELRPKVKSINPTKCYVLTDPLVKARGNIAKCILLKILGVHCPIYGWRDFVKTVREKSIATEVDRCINHTLSCLESVLEDKSIVDSELIVKFPIVVSEEGKKAASDIWENYGLKGKRVYIFSPGGIKPHKIWPIEKYVKVMKILLEKNDLEILVTGTNKDLELGKKIDESLKSDRVHNLIGKTDLQCLAGLLQKADLLVGNDGGTMHIGDAVGCTVVAIMPGLELPRTVEPWHNMKNSLRKQLSCAPCYNFDNCPNKTFRCTIEIDEEEVLEKISNAEMNREKYNEVRVLVNREGKIPVLRILDS